MMKFNDNMDYDIAEEKDYDTSSYFLWNTLEYFWNKKDDYVSYLLPKFEDELLELGNPRANSDFAYCVDDSKLNEHLDVIIDHKDSYCEVTDLYADDILKLVGRIDTSKLLDKKYEQEVNTFYDKIEKEILELDDVDYTIQYLKEVDCIDRYNNIFPSLVFNNITPTCLDNRCSFIHSYQMRSFGDVENIVEKYTEYLRDLNNPRSDNFIEFSKAFFKRFGENAEILSSTLSFIIDTNKEMVKEEKTQKKKGGR